MNNQLIRWLLFGLGLVCGGGLFMGFISALLIVLAQSAGAGWQQRHIDAAKEMEMER